MVGAFIHPMAVSASAEILYEDAKHFQEDLDRFSRHVVSIAVGSDGATPSDHFGRAVAVYGEWGSGKSTALGYMRRKVLELTCAALAEALVGRDGAAAPDAEDLVRFEVFDAREWEGCGDPRPALAYSLLLGAGRLDIATISGFRRSFGLGRAVSPSGDDSELAREFFEGMGHVPEWPLAEKWVRQHVRRALMPGPTAGAGSGQRFGKTLVLLIENLDRSSAAFVSGLLAAMDGWLQDEEMPVFFVLASSRDHLLESLAEVPLGRRSPEETLEKYVHTEIHVPSLLSDSSQVAGYLEGVLGVAQSDASAARDGDGSVDAVSTLRVALRLARQDGEPWSSVLFPLTVNEEREITPRRAVDRLNKLLGTITVTEDAVTGGDPLKARRALKLNVIRAFWPKFYDRVVRPLELASGEGALDDLREAMDIVREIGHVTERARRRHLDSAEDAAKALLDSVTSYVPILGPGVVDPRLARYLAMEPPWPSGSPLEDTTRVPDDGGINDSQDLADLATLSSALLSRESTPESPVPDHGEDRDTAEMDFTRAYLRMDAALGVGRPDDGMRALTELVALVRGFPNADFDAAQVGNAALRAETLKASRAALILHLNAHRIDPHHPNVAQNLADFLLDPRNFEGSLEHDLPVAQRLTMAESLLDELEAKHPAHKPWRTSELRAKLATLKGEGVDVDDIQTVVDHFREEPSFNRYLALARLYAGGQLDSDRFMEAGRMICETDPALAIRALRVIADQLVSEDGNEKQAADIYLMIVEKGIDPNLLDSDFLHDMWNNLAYALRSAGFPKAGLRCMVALHLRYPTSVETRARLARMLSSEHEPTLAVSVFDGKVLPEASTFAGLPPAESFQTPLTDPPEWWWEVELPQGVSIDPIFREMA